MLCLIRSAVFSKVETASNAAARLTGFFFIEKYGADTLKTVGATAAISEIV